MPGFLLEKVLIPHILFNRNWRTLTLGNLSIPSYNNATTYRDPALAGDECPQAGGCPQAREWIEAEKNGSRLDGVKVVGPLLAKALTDECFM